MMNDYIAGSVIRRYLPMSIFSMAAATIGMLIDGVIIGNYMGAEAMAAFGACGPLFMVYAAVAGIFGNGSVSVCGRYVGRNEPDRVNQVFSTILFTALGAALLLMLFSVASSGTIARLLGAGRELKQMASSYILGLGIGVVPIVAYQVLIAFIRTDGNPGMALTSIIGMTMANVGLDLLNVYVLGWGMFGMALATSISYAVACLICGTHFLSSGNTLRLSKSVFKVRELKKVLVAGSPNALMKICVTGKTALLNNILGIVGGSAAISALSIQGSLNTLLGSIGLGIGSTTLLVCGVFYGEQDKRMLISSFRILLKTGIVLSCTAALISILFVSPLVSMFGKDDWEVSRLAVQAVTSFLLGMPLYTVGLILLNFYQSSGNLKMANAVCIGENFGFVLLFVVLLTPFLGVSGVWYSFVLGELLLLPALLVLVRRQLKRWPRCLEDFLLLPDGFAAGDAGDLRLEYSLRNEMSDVIGLSRQILAFCRERNVDARRSYFLALCIEEMLGNVVKYAFDRGKRHFVDVRILIKPGGDIVFRIRDDGRRFNPLAFGGNRNDDFSNIGIRLVKSISKKIDYQNMMGLNNLIVTI